MTALWFQGGRIDPHAIVTNVPQPFSAASEVTAWTATPAQTPAAIPQAIIVSGRVFAYDSADTTSAHDGALVCVSSDGKRYKSADIPPVISVQSSTVTSPPALSSAIYQQAWLVPPAATGAWAGHDDDVVIATGRGWVFVLPEAGRVIYDIAATQFKHLSASGVWTSGLGTPSPGTVTAEALEWPWGVIVESRSLNVAPTSAGRKAYIVGPAPTGTWAGKAGYLAIGPTGGWSYIAPVSGAEVWCREDNRYVRYISGAWTTDAGSLQSIRRTSNPASISGGAYTISGTAPTVSNTVSPALALTHAARASGNVLRLRFQCEASVAGVVSLFIDAAATADQWGSYAIGGGVLEFLVTVGDASLHQYAIRTAGITATKSSLTLEELSIQS